jgi:transcriptional regulator with XRE-family HTH domain
MAEILAYYDMGEVMSMVYPRIRALREDRDWSQQKIADILHINRRTYSAYENGVNAMSPETLSALADIHGTSVDYLLGRTDQPSPYPKKKP